MLNVGLIIQLPEFKYKLALFVMSAYHSLLVLILVFLVCSCEESGNADSPASVDIPETNITLPEELNLRENLLEMRGLTADFTEESWQSSGLDVVAPWRPGGSHFVLGRLQPVPASVTTLLILEDRPEQSTAWAVNYTNGQLTDFLEVFHMENGGKRTVGSNWRSGRLDIQLDRGAERYGETFQLDDSGKWVPFSERQAPM